jgi:hypothetical protein
LSTAEIAELVDSSWKLQQVVNAGERASIQLNSNKARLRELANGKDRQFVGKIATASVEQKPDTVCRVVDDALVPKILKLVGEAWGELFTLHPTKGREKSFELNSRKTLPKKAASTLLDWLSAPASAWVRFTRNAV